MNKKKIGIATLYTGYNFGSALQACATKMVLKELGHDGCLLSLKGSFIKGRDVRLRKLFVMMKRVLFNIGKFDKQIKAYKASLSKKVTKKEKELFDSFFEKYLEPYRVTWTQLKKETKKGNFDAFVAGSDQIWNSEAIYVDPFYYLRFAPKEKRIAFAPSFGREYIAEYNKKTIKKYIQGFSHISVREYSGIDIVRKLTKKDAVCLIDPSLTVSKEKWITNLNLQKKDADYILTYFLSEPSEYAKQYVKKLAAHSKLEIISITDCESDNTWFDKKIEVGPKEFLEYLLSSKYVCTDSFHGTAFSLNFEIPFFVFARQYGSAGDQSNRIKSLLSILNMDMRYEPEMDMIHDIFNSDLYRCALEEERYKSRNYLLEALNSI